MNKYISLGLILIFLGLSVKAATLEGDFTAEAYQSQPLEKVFTLCNDSSHSESYSIDEFGEYSYWMHVKPEELSLSAGKCEDIYAFITPEPYAREGSYDLGIRIRNSKTLDKIIELTVLQGHTLSLSVDESYKEASQCEERNYSLKIKNTGIFEERAKIEVEGLNELWFEFDSDEPVLEKNESTTVRLSVKAPCNAERKAYEFTVKASIPYTDFETEEVLTYKVVNEQEVMIDVKEEVSACKDSTETEEITFKNN
ncbi:hypothetical protein KJ660_02680, partial [Candidatus Micrarchaeota archaeon]|nr:hypothetical protein [Candidatus Micrarchaeota archaeon]